MKAFFDTNVFVYSTTGDQKGRIAARLIQGEGGLTSYIVLNEFIDVARRKLRKEWPDVTQAVDLILHAMEQVTPVTTVVFELGAKIARDHQFRIYDACIIASASLAGCKTLYSEDLADGAVIAGVTIINPFKDAGLAAP